MMMFYHLITQVMGHLYIWGEILIFSVIKFEIIDRILACIDISLNYIRING